MEIIKEDKEVETDICGSAIIDHYKVLRSMYLELTVMMEVNEVDSIRNKIEEVEHTLRELDSEEKPSLYEEGMMLKLMNQAIKDLEA